MVTHDRLVDNKKTQHYSEIGRPGAPQLRPLLSALRYQMSTVLQTPVPYFALSMQFAAAFTDIVRPNTAEAVPTERLIEVEKNREHVCHDTTPPQQQIHPPHRMIQNVVASYEPAQVESVVKHKEALCRSHCNDRQDSAPNSHVNDRHLFRTQRRESVLGARKVDRVPRHSIHGDINGELKEAVAEEINHRDGENEIDHISYGRVNRIDNVHKPKQVCVQEVKIKCCRDNDADREAEKEKQHESV